MFIPATPEEVRKLGWTRLDVILLTGDSYLDSPYVGVSVIGQRLLAAGYRVGIIPQPDIARLKEMGVAEVFIPGASIKSIADFIKTKCGG